MLIDSFGRKITYLRVSVTDRCNFRCVYCMPPQGVTWQAHENILHYEEIAQVVRMAAAGGVREIRLTGGEPLVRRKLDELVAMIAAIPGIEDIALTTNGILLAEQAERLAQAGLKRVNVSLDTLNPEKFKRITRGGQLERVWQGIEKAEASGLIPIKLNVVAMRGVNDDELPDLARLTLEHAWQVRFIEIMPVKNQAPWGEDFPDPAHTYFPVQEILRMLEPLGLEPANGSAGSGPARTYRIPGGRGKIGLITPLGEQFCQDCNRLRLTADGLLRPCLLNDDEVSIRDALRRGEDLTPYFSRALKLKPLSHKLEENLLPIGRCMTQIGG